jgi:phage baseplate assembly protein gpV
MDEQHIQQMIEVMLACHGAEADSAARKRANRCLRRKEPEWAAMWREVADRIARGVHTASTPTLSTQTAATQDTGGQD